MEQNKNHWYDGWFYDVFIAPNQDRMFSEIKKIIEPNSKVIDIGCGTGRFSFSVADGVNKVVGIDLSKKILIKQIRSSPKIQTKEFHFFIQIFLL